MIEVDVKTIGKVAKTVARKYARRCWWADKEDLEQEALLTILQCRYTFKQDVHRQPHEVGDRGVPFEKYAARAAMLALRVYLLRESAPVSARGNNGAMGVLAGIFRAPTSSLDHTPHEACLQDQEVLHQLWLSKVRAVVARLLDEMDATATGAAFLAEPVLLHDARPYEVARRTGVPVKRVYRAVQQFKAFAVADPELHTLWKAR